MGLSGILLAFGVFLKNKTPINTEWIPMILLVIAVPVYLAASWPVDWNSGIMAVGSALSAVGAYELTRSTKNATQPKKAAAKRVVDAEETIKTQGLK